jgi:hypothetical protein
VIVAIRPVPAGLVRRCIIHQRGPNFAPSASSTTAGSATASVLIPLDRRMDLSFWNYDGLRTLYVISGLSVATTRISPASTMSLTTMPIFL